MRWLQIDILRAVAVLLVLGRHKPAWYTESDWLTGPAIHYWQKIGWIGVDLFFVLSGFLVSGLLFKEFRSRGRLDTKRFLIRRGLKIYPPLYCFILVALSLAWFKGQSLSWPVVLAQLAFLQNYLGCIWVHTWSLAVEEHFYLGLALFFPLLLAVHRDEPCRYLGPLIALVGLMALGTRVVTALLVPYSVAGNVMPTHLRIDSLLFGVLLAYWHHFKPHRLAFARHHRAATVLAAAALLAPCFVFDQHEFVMHTFGFTLLYLGFGALLLVALDTDWPRGSLRGRLSRLLAGIGAHSYSIYLWHMMVRGGVVWVLEKCFGRGLPFLVVCASYVVGSLVFGILMAKCLEAPILAVRDRFFPSRSDSRGRPEVRPVPALAAGHQVLPVEEIARPGFPSLCK